MLILRSCNLKQWGFVYVCLRETEKDGNEETGDGSGEAGEDGNGETGDGSG